MRRDYFKDKGDRLGLMTVWEVARQANVSIATVSRVVNRVESVRPSIARRVRRVIAETGYCPNTHARALVSGCSRTLGLVLDITHPFFTDLVQTFTELGFDHDYEILLGVLTDDTRSFTAAVRQMKERRVDGVALMSPGKEEVFAKALAGRNAPVFAMEADSPGPLLKTLRIDYQHGIRQAVQHLAALGHIRIAFVSGPPESKTAMQRKAAFLQSMREIDLEMSPQLLVVGDHTIAGGRRAVSVLTALRDRPSAIVCSNDMTAVGGIHQACAQSLSIPRQLSIVGCDDIHLAEFMIPSLTTVRMPPIEIANLAFRALLDSTRPSRSGLSHEVYTIKTNLVLRGSTGLAPDRMR